MATAKFVSVQIDLKNQIFVHSVVLETQKMSFFSISLDKIFTSVLKSLFILYGMFLYARSMHGSLKNQLFSFKISFENFCQNLKG